MRTVLKWAGYVLGGLVVLLVVAAVGVYVASESKLYQKYPVADIAITVPKGAASVERGRHLVNHVSVCVGCHGTDLGGGVIVDDPALGRIYAPNITTGQGGKGGEVTDADIARLLRTAVLPDGRSLWIMPAEDYQYLSDADLAAIIAYVRSVPPVDKAQPAISFGPLGRVLMVTGQLPVNTADNIDPNTPKPPAPPEGVTVEYGHYLANISGCTGCHGPGLSGGPIPGTPPDTPPASNITTAGAIAGWTEAQFLQTIRTGTDPAGHVINEFMPWKLYASMTDDELKAIWMFLQAAPPKEYGNR